MLCLDLVIMGCSLPLGCSCGHADSESEDEQGTELAVGWVPNVVNAGAAHAGGTGAGG